MEIEVVPDEACPECGGSGSPKVGDENGNWWWKCYSSREDCNVAYWLPETGEIEYRVSIEEEMLNKKIAQLWVKNSTFEGDAENGGATMITPHGLSGSEFKKRYHEGTLPAEYYED